MSESINPIQKRDKELHNKLYDFIDSCNFPEDVKSLIFQFEEIDVQVKKIQSKSTKEDMTAMIVHQAGLMRTLNELIKSKNNPELSKKFEEYKSKKKEIENLTNPEQPWVN